MKLLRFGVRWQSAAATPLWERAVHPQKRRGASLPAAVQDDWLSLCRSASLRHSAFALILHVARKRKGVTPVIDEVYAMFYEGKDVRQAVQDLTMRESEVED